jgi:hypothetical protein
MRDAPPPGVEAHQIDGDRCDNVLESRFGEPAVPRLAQLGSGKHPNRKWR